MTQARRSHDPGSLRYIDALRGLAILMVILTHVGESVRGLSGVASAIALGGQTGVQLFFVASAYTLCLTAVRRAGEPHATTAFLIRRFFRIAPLYYTAIALYFGLHVLTFGHDHPGEPFTAYPYSVRNVLANVLFVHGFVPSANNNIVPGGWSIGTEMAFYVAFPQLFLWARRLAAASIAHALAAGVAMLGLNVALQSLLLFYTGHYAKNDNFIYFNIFNQLPVFWFGMVVFARHFGSDAYLRRPSAAIELGGCLVFAGLTAVIWWADFPLAFALIPTTAGVSACFVVDLARRYEAFVGGLARIGRVSYSMYVFHFVFAWTLTGQIAGLLTKWLVPDAALILCFVASAAGAYTVAIASRQLIEEPGIELGRRLLRWLNANARQPAAAANSTT